MKIFLLCGGFGSRLDHEGKLKAKTMVKIGNKPILLHIIENFNRQGFNQFVICLGYKAETILNYFLKNNKKNTRIISKNKNKIVLIFKKNNLKSKLYFIYTGINTGTAGRIKIAFNSLMLKEDILMTYGDGLSNLSIKKLIKFHYKKKSLVTITAVKPKQRYGILKIKNNKVLYFDNSKKKSDIYVNGGFHVIDKSAIKYIKNTRDYWEDKQLRRFKSIKKLYAFKHEGFWKSLDTLKDKNEFNEIIKQKKLPWIR